jgi:outer membrane protein assembly factor BamB
MGTGYASVSVANGTLYTTGNDAVGQRVVAVDTQTGRVLWSTHITDGAPDHSHPGSRCTPTVDGGRLYVVASSGSICCLERADGAIVWQREFSDWEGRMMSGWGFSEAPLVDGDSVLCTPGGRAAVVVKLDKSSGEEIWRAAPSRDGRRDSGKEGAGYSSIMITEAGGVRQYVQLVGRGLIGLRASDGKLLWSYGRVANGTANVPTPIVSGNFVFASTGYNTGAALLELTPSGDGGVSAREVYFLPPDTFQNHHGGMIQIGDHIYAGNKHGSGFPICLEWKTGRVVWGEGIRGAGTGSAAVTAVGDRLLFRYQNGVLAAIRATPEGYQLEGSFKPEYQKGNSWSHPVVVDGRLYLREQEKLMCYDVSPR